MGKQHGAGKPRAGDARSHAPRSTGTAAQRALYASPTRIDSDESLPEMGRTESLASLRVFAQLIDGRSGYYEDARMSDAQLSEIQNKGVRELYERQNELLDGWREVDEVLESQFPAAVMRRFVVPGAPAAGGAASGAAGAGAGTGAIDMRGEGAGASRYADDDDAFGTDEESDSLWTHPFQARHGPRISERTLTSISGMLSNERVRRNSCVDVAAESLQDLSTSAMMSDANREHDSFADLVRRSEHERAKTPKARRNRSMLRKMLSENPAVDKTYGAVDAPHSDERVDAPERSAAPRAVWTKADHERDQLLQNVPTHQRKQDFDAVVKFYININLLINLLLVVGKVVAVWSSNSVSLLASLVDSVLDLLCTVVIFIMSRASAYRSWHTFYKYPVGKRRLEPLGVLIFSVLMVVSFLQVLVESVNRLWGMLVGRADEPELVLPRIGVVFMVLTIVIKTIMWLLCRHHKNSSMHAIAQDSENDAMFNIISLVFPTLGQYLGLRVLDPVGGAALSLYIISEWVATLADTTDKLTGKVASAQDVSRCLYLVSRFSPVQAISNFEMYHVGDTMVAEVDLVLPMSFKLKEAHDLGEIVTYCIESLSGLERAYVHLDYNPTGQSGHIGQRG